MLSEKNKEKSHCCSGIFFYERIVGLMEDNFKLAQIDMRNNKLQG